MSRSREETHLPALYKAYQDMQKLDPYKAAYMAGCNFNADAQGGRFIVPYFGQEYWVAFPRIAVQDINGKEPDITTRLLLLHYLINADGTPPANHWIAFRELPDGRVYDPAFQKRASLRLVSAYGADAGGLAAAAEALGGERLAFGDLSYMFRVLPRIAMAVILHLGDEEFGPAVNMLFDGAAGHYLPIEDLAVLGSVLAGRLIKAKKSG